LKRKSQTKSLELFAPRPVAPLIDPEAIWTANVIVDDSGGFQVVWAEIDLSNA
jgi:hypothetical protein